MHEHTHHHEEPEYPVRGRRRDRHHHVEESGHREHHEGWGDHPHEGPEHHEHGGRARGRGHVVSWRVTEEDGPPHRGRRERVERGMLRYLLLDALLDGPKHGYEIIKWLEERTYGRYAPSPGTLYPTLQLLEDQGLILVQQSNEKRSYQLSESGKQELAAHADFTRDFWERNGQPLPSPATQLESEFVYEDLQDLQRTVERGVRLTQDQQRLLALRQALERCKNEVRALLTGSATPQPPRPGNGPYDARLSGRELEQAIARLFAPEDEVLRQTTARAREQGLPPIQISPLQGKLLQVLAKACQARKILEIGALAGYSGIWLARALPEDGRLITLEIDETHAAVVRESFREAQVADRAEVRVGPALETLPLLAQEGPFDLIFIDADKTSYPQYLTWAIQLAHPGSIIVADNCVLGGDGIADAGTAESPRGAGARAYNQQASSNPALCSIALPLSSGMTVAIVQATPEAQ